MDFRENAGEPDSTYFLAQSTQSPYWLSVSVTRLYHFTCDIASARKIQRSFPRLGEQETRFRSKYKRSSLTLANGSLPFLAMMQNIGKRKPSTTQLA